MIKPKVPVMVAQTIDKLACLCKYRQKKKCTLAACKKVNGRHGLSTIAVITALFDECKEDFIENSHLMCTDCAGKVKKKFLDEKVIRKEPYVEMVQEISHKVIKVTEIVDKKNIREAITLTEVLESADDQLKDALLATWDNVALLWWHAEYSDKALNHYGRVPSAEEWNCLMHTENGNILGFSKIREKLVKVYQHMTQHNRESWKEDPVINIQREEINTESEQKGGGSKDPPIEEINGWNREPAHFQ